MMGWGGIRIHDDGLKAAPTLPAEVKTLKIYGLHYNGEIYNLSADHNGYKLEKQN
jgi:trehalose/maltose hydrolase-like predicted phosphorylase